MNETAPPAGKVVRLPRDWLGPHDELVPFGRQSTPSETEPGESEPTGSEAAASEPAGSPPSAEDFWGERSAAIHDVVLAPPDAVARGVASAAESRSSAPRLRFGRRHLTAASVLAAAAATVTAVVVLSGGAVHQIAGGARLNLAAIFSGGVSRSLTIASLRISSATTSSRPHAPSVPHVAHRPPVTKPASHSTQHHGSGPTRAPTYAVRSTPTNAAPIYRSDVSVSRSRADTTPPPPRASPSSGASVSPTGESGALGPVQSPNG